MYHLTEMMRKQLFLLNFKYIKCCMTFICFYLDSRNKDEITVERIATAKVIIFGGPRRKFTANEVNNIFKQFIVLLYVGFSLGKLGHKGLQRHYFLSFDYETTLVEQGMLLYPFLKPLIIRPDILQLVLNAWWATLSFIACILYHYQYHFQFSPLTFFHKIYA